jgi:hypothetical protein
MIFRKYFDEQVVIKVRLRVFVFICSYNHVTDDQISDSRREFETTVSEKLD